AEGRAFTPSSKSRIVRRSAHEARPKNHKPGGYMLARWRYACALSGCLIAASIALTPAPAAEVYRPDPQLVEAARKEGQLLWYTTLIVDQIVRPLIKAF